MDIWSNPCTWNYSGSPVKLNTTTDSNSAKIKVSYSNTDSGTYATAYKGNSNIFYKPFNTLSTTRKKETAVHEFGHTIGLDHTQKSNESKSVRRAKGFIDKAGLNYIY